MVAIFVNQFAFVGFLALLTPNAVHSLADLPVVGTFPSFSLNGEWHASGQTREIIEASKEIDVDFLNPNGGQTVKATPVAYRGNLDQCCQLCGASATCAASVWDGSRCTFRRPQDLEYRVQNQTGKTACVFNVTSSVLSINGTVPGDLVTDLQKHGIVDNPLLDTNFQTQAGNWSGHTWTYSKSFVLPAELAAPTNALLIVFEGIKMGATVSFNKHVLGNATNQHRRWVWPVDPALLSTASPDGSHIVEVTFDSNIATEGRYMDCSGGWDWSPYSFMRDVDGNPMWTRGIWKDVYLVGFPRAAAAALTYVVPQVRYVGPHSDPTTLLPDGGDNPFEVDVCVHMYAAVAGVKGTVVVAGSWGDEKRMPVTLTLGEDKICTKLHAAAPRLWWPRGMGHQHLYNVTARFEPATPHGGSPVSASRRIGFRHVILVTGNDTNASWVAHAEAAKLEGNGKHTLMFRVNGAPFYAKGANMIPMDALEGRLRTGQHREHVNSAADAGMNMLRVWGGGVYPPDEWFDACDERGVLVFEDFMYGTDGIMPGAQATPNQEAEIRHQVRRLGHHASLVAWSGCNECGGMGVYTDFVITTAVTEDKTRPVRSSCPWVGYSQGVDILTGLPNGKKLMPVQPPKPPPPPPAPAPSPTCSFEAGVDYHPDTVLSTTPTNNATKCCEACGADSKCVVAVLYAGTCYLKAAKDAKVRYNRSGRITCQPKRPAYHEAMVAPDGNAMPYESASPFPGGADIHGPYQHGGLFPARNGGGHLFSPPVVVDVNPGNAVGASAPGYFRTETGCSVLSSFESMAPTLSPSNWGIHSDPFHERNYPCDPIILSYFGNVDLDKRGEAAFKQQLYLCMLGQGLQRKTDIESWRSGNIWGSLMWQLGEIWPTGGWGSLEYGTPGQPGAVTGGRWKPLHYFMRQSAFADIAAACGNAKVQMNDAGPHASGPAICYVKNDLPTAFKGSMRVQFIHLSTAAVTTVSSTSVNLPPGAGAAGFWCANGAPFDAAKGVLACPTFESLLTKAACSEDGSDCVMRVAVTADAPDTLAAGVLLADNLLPLTPPSNMTLAKATVTATVTSIDSTPTIRVTSSGGVALYVWLSTLADGRFEDNGFLLLPSAPRDISFIPFQHFDHRLLVESLRVEHLQQNMPATE